MPNVMLAARTAAESTFVVVTSSAAMINNGVTSLADLTQAGADLARNYRTTTKRKLSMDQMASEERMLHELAITNREHADGIAKRLGNDPARVKAFDADVTRMRKHLEELKASEAA